MECWIVCVCVGGGGGGGGWTITIGVLMDNMYRAGLE